MQIRRFQRLAGVMAFLLAASLSVLAQQHVSNPFVGATQYVNPDYAAEVQSVIAQTTNPTLAAQMSVVATYPTAVWMDHIGAIAGNSSSPGGRLGLAQHLNTALSQEQGTTPIVIELVIYDLPDRDCAALASNGELSIAANPPTQPLDGLTTYEQQYITPIANVLSNPTYANVRFVLVIEPDSLPNLVTNTGLSFNISNCDTAQSSGVYEQGIQFAINTFHAIPNAYLYLDIGHSAWLGWPNNASGAITLYTNVVSGTTAGLNSVDGFIDDTANYTPLKEPFINASQTFNGTQIISANFYQFNPTVDEQGYATELQNMFRAAGWPVSSTNFITDTSRNGWGGPNRPTAASTSTDVNTYVNASKIDERNHRGQWCNQSNAGLGIPPLASPPDFPQFQAYVWIKPPGESDGTYPGSANQDGAVHADPNCNPASTNPLAGNTLTGSIANSPPAGQFFNAEFTQLIQNAFPAVPATTTPSFSISGTGTSVEQGASATTSILVLPVNGFAGTVNLSVSGLPTGVTAAFSPASIAGGKGISTLTFTAAANAPVPSTPVNVTVSGTSGATTEITTLSLTIVGRPDFSITAVAPGTVTLTPNSNPTAQVTVAALFGFTGTVSISAANLPAGVSANFSPSSVNGSGTITINFNGQTNTPTGTTNISIVGTSGTITHSATIAFTVVGPASFSLSANPTSVSMAQGGTATSAITVTPSNGFTGTVAFTVSGLPSGVTASFSPTSSTTGSTVTFSASSSAAAGTTNVTITGSSGNTQSNTSIAVTVATQANFSLSASPASVSVNQGGTASSTITVTPVAGFTGSVALTASGLPTGVTASFSPASTTGTSVLTFIASSTATPGASTVTVTGTSGTLSHTATIALTVVSVQPSFTLSANPTALSVAQGATSSGSTITVNPANGFTGTVALAASGLPSGVTANFSPASTTGSSTVTFTASSTAAAGTASVIITGTSGSLGATTTIALTVTSNQPSFTLSANPTALSLAQGATSANSTLTVNPVNGFSGAVTLAASGLPAGVTANFSAGSITTTGTVTFTASSTATAGTTNVTITGTNGSLHASATIAVSVTTTNSGGGVTVSTVINSNSAFFDDEGVKISNTGAITALSITINVQNTGGLGFSGQYNTVGGSIVDSHSSTASVITYQYNLSAGQTLSPGSGYLFDAQMSATGTAHPVTGDTFTVTYTTGGQTFTQSGVF